MTKQDTEETGRLVRYLLGQADAEEQIRIEERYLADPDFHEELRAAERDLIDQYVAGELPDPSGFEKHFLESPGRRRRVEFARALRRSLAESGVSQASAAGRQDTRSPAEGALSRSLWPGRWGWWVAAAACVVILGVAFLANWPGSDGSRTEVAETSPQEPPRTPTPVAPPARSPDARSSPSVPAPVRVATIVLLPTLSRNGDQTQTLSIGPDVDNVQLHLSVEPGDYATYRVDMRTVDGDVVWHEDRLRITEMASGEVISTTVPAQRLRNLYYTIRLSGVTSAGEIEQAASYYFRVRKR